MATCTLSASQLGPIKEATVSFGDLTVLVGPQATGKSIFLQLFKLLVDTSNVLADLKRYGLRWDRDPHRLLDIYLGEGMSRVLDEKRSSVSFRGKAIDFKSLAAGHRRKKKETMFFIPAQRVLTLGKGWPRPFSDYSPGDPFVVRDFSEKIRTLVESDLKYDKSLFPQTQRLKAEERKLLKKTVFLNFGLQVDEAGLQRRLVLSAPGSKTPLPFMVWSAGQREFVPLLLGSYWLLPSGRVRRRADFEWVVIEELEMGLHPRAISAVLLLVLDLLSRDYRVCLSTHSPHVLDVVWALKVFREHNADPARLLDLFEVRVTGPMRRIAEAALKKEARVYYFDPESGKTRDISNLDPGAEEAAESDWGGLTAFSGQVAEVVAEVVSDSME